jgi:hypothetical protein
MVVSNKYKFIILIVSILIVISVLVIIVISNPLSNNEDENVNNIGKMLLGKWKLVNTTYSIKGEIIKSTIDSEFDMEFFGNGSCKQLMDYENDSYTWEKWTLRETHGEDYIVFGEDPLPEGGDAFISNFVEFSKDGNSLSLYHAHLMTTRNYCRVQYNN